MVNFIDTPGSKDEKASVGTWYRAPPTLHLSLIFPQRITSFSASFFGFHVASSVTRYLARLADYMSDGTSQ